MENASKALIMAGGVLIAILIISLGIGLASMMQEHSKPYYETLSTQEIAKINAEITKDFTYLKLAGDTESKQYITAQGIVTLKNLIKELEKQGIDLSLDWYDITDLDILNKKAIAIGGSSNGKTCYYCITKVEYDSNNKIIKNIKIAKGPKTK